MLNGSAYMEEQREILRESKDQPISIPGRVKGMTKLGLCPGSRLETECGDLGQYLVDNGYSEKSKD